MASVGASVARLSDARLSMMRFTHSWQRPGHTEMSGQEGSAPPSGCKISKQRPSRMPLIPVCTVCQAMTQRWAAWMRGKRLIRRPSHCSYQGAGGHNSKYKTSIQEKTGQKLHAMLLAFHFEHGHWGAHHLHRRQGRLAQEERAARCSRHRHHVHHQLHARTVKNLLVPNVPAVAYQAPRANRRRMTLHGTSW